MKLFRYITMLTLVLGSISAFAEDSEKEVNAPASESTTVDAPKVENAGGEGNKDQMKRKRPKRRHFREGEMRPPGQMGEGEMRPPQGELPPPPQGGMQPPPPQMHPQGEMRPPQGGMMPPGQHRPGGPGGGNSGMGPGAPGSGMGPGGMGGPGGMRPPGQNRPGGMRPPQQGGVPGGMIPPGKR